MAYNGAGLVWCTESLVQEEVAAGRLQEIPLDVGASELMVKHIQQFQL